MTVSELRRPIKANVQMTEVHPNLRKRKRRVHVPMPADTAHLENFTPPPGVSQFNQPEYLMVQN